MRRSATVITTTLIALALGASPASAAAGDNFIQAQATAQNPTSELSGVSVAVNPSDTVDNGNLAEAYAHDCTGCRAVAVAFQVILIPGSPHTVGPGNLATAANNRCTRCTAVAVAKQYLIYTGGATRIDQDAERAVARIRAQVEQVTASGASPADLEQALRPLFGALVRNVRDGLIDADIKGGIEHDVTRVLQGS